MTPIVLCCDSNYVPYAAVSTYSAHKNAQESLRVYWVVPFPDVEKAKPAQEILVELGIDIQLVGVDDSRFSQWMFTSHIGRASYLRLTIPDLIKESKVIYLDCDTLVLGDLTALYKTEMKDYPFAGVADAVGAQTSKVPRDKADTYINAGVLLMNLDGLRRDNFNEKLGRVYAQHHDTVTWLDQCIINKYAEHKKLLVDPRWNRLIWTESIKENVWKEIVADGKSAVLHFCGGIKPWHGWCNPYIAQFWWQYANELKLPGFVGTKITTVNQALTFAQVLDRNERFKDASMMKDQVINHLLQQAQSKK
jgi:lipopolysaccharide biosynthesis glycosyltransferase